MGFAGLLTAQTGASLLAGLAAFAAVASLLLPRKRDERLTARLKKVASERQKLREARFAAAVAPPRSRLRFETHSWLKALASTLKVHELFDTAGVAARLRMAGLRGPGPETTFLFLRATLPLMFFAVVFAAMILRPGSMVTPLRALFLAMVAGGVGFSLPRFILSQLIARRQRAIIRAFPDALDLLLICVQSGMSVEAALAKVTKDIASQSIELAEELSLTMAELAYLPTRWEAYRNLGERTGLPAVKLIAAALAQAERHGTSISHALTVAAKECRDARFAMAEQKAASLPPKLTVPLVTFFLPILLVILLAPAVIKMKAAMRQKGAQFINPPSLQQDARSPAARTADGVHPASQRR